MSIVWDKVIDALAGKAGVTFFDYQLECFEKLQSAQQAGENGRLCLYYKTGAGKSLTALVCARLWGAFDVVVIAPPSTHSAWFELGLRIGMKVETMSHAKFRMPATKLKRNVAVIADEIHMFGGHKGQGWQKLNRLAKGLQAPLILASATPNYNDADRVYCIQSILDPHSVKGGFLQFLYDHCTTEQNPFGMMPNVTGFQRYDTAAAYLADLPLVAYLPDDLDYQIEDRVLKHRVNTALNAYGYDHRKHRMIASIMERRHVETYQAIVRNGSPSDDDLFDVVWDWVEDLLNQAKGPVLIFSNHATIAKAVIKSFEVQQVKQSYALVTGHTSKKNKEKILQEFKAGGLDILVGTASLATGTDGLDKVCDWLIILDDTDDDSLRRQLVGRIMPRGADEDATGKHVHRLVLS